MKPDPSPAAFLNVSSECRSGLGRPPIRRIVQLNKDAVLRQERVVDLAGILNVIDREIVIDRLLLQPFFGRIYKGPMNSTGLGKRDDLESRGGRLCGHIRCEK
jgi:hypothetical protein